MLPRPVRRELGRNDDRPATPEGRCSGDGRAVHVGRGSRPCRPSTGTRAMVRTTSVWIVVLLVTAAGWGGRAHAQAGDAASPPPRLGATTTSQRVSLHVHGTALDTVLKDLVPWRAITVTRSADPRGVVLDVAPGAGPLYETLRRALAAFDVVFVYGARSGTPDTLTAVWVYPHGDQSGEAPRASADDVSDTADRAELGEPQRIVEEETAPDAAGAEVSTDRIHDPDPRMRLLALSPAFAPNVPVPAADVELLALIDPDPQVRGAALAALAFHPAVSKERAEQIALEASQSPIPLVQRAGMELLQNIEETRRSAPGVM